MILLSRVFVLQDGLKTRPLPQEQFQCGILLLKVQHIGKVFARSNAQSANYMTFLWVTTRTNLWLQSFYFFMNVAVILKGYLVFFQTNNPMIPFFSDLPEGMIRKIMKTFIRKEVLTEASTVRKLMKTRCWKSWKLTASWHGEPRNCCETYLAVKRDNKRDIR